tara:strand:- start:891 stop:1205 length:315 start_codon:yes stop_codon:yes gene_type:complete
MTPTDLRALADGVGGGICRTPLLAIVGFVMIYGVAAVWLVVTGLFLILFNKPTWMSRPGWWDRQHIKLRHPKRVGWFLFLIGVGGVACGFLSPFIFAFCYSGPQ